MKSKNRKKLTAVDCVDLSPSECGIYSIESFILNDFILFIVDNWYLINNASVAVAGVSKSSDADSPKAKLIPIICWVGGHIILNI